MTVLKSWLSPAKFTRSATTGTPGKMLQHPKRPKTPTVDRDAKPYATGDDLKAARAKLRKRARGLEAIRQPKASATRRREMAEGLWELVSRQRGYLDSLKNRPVLDSLSEAWGVLADQRHVAHTPFEALFFYVEMGFYPPPELLLALRDMWGQYLNGGGDLSLEQVFLGPSVKKGGNHAKRHRTWARDAWMSIQLQALKAEGHSTMKAAEMISERLGGKPEPESIVRLVNKHPFASMNKKQGS